MCNSQQLLTFAIWKAKMKYSVGIIVLSLLLHFEDGFAQETECKNFYEDFSCETYKARKMCSMFKQYCALTCGGCRLSRTTQRQRKCENIYDDYSCQMFKIRQMCRMFKKYCALTCDGCPTRPPPTTTRRTYTRRTTTERPVTTPSVPRPSRWTRCTKTCGGGTRYRFKSIDCTNAYNPECEREFEECFRRDCPFEACGNNQEHRFGQGKGCCNRRGPASEYYKRQPRSNNAWPWTALVTSFGDICGGALIDDDWVITAAHCVTAGRRIISRTRIDVYIGIDNLEDATRKNRYSVERTVIHPKHRREKNDIALIKLKSSSRQRSHVSISLPRREITPIDSTCVATGWGFSGDMSSRSRPRLHEELQIFDFGVCRAIFSNSTTIGDLVSKRRPGLLCAGSFTERNRICDGYNGSPIVCQRCTSCDWYLAGIATTIRQGACREEGYPTLLTGVRSHELWIRRYVRGLPSSTISCPYKYGP